MSTVQNGEENSLKNGIVEVEDEVEESTNLSKVLDICNELEVGIQFEESDIEISKFKSGFVSEIYRVVFLKLKPPVPQSIVIKFYNTETTKEESGYEIVNSQLNNLLIAQAGLGPKVYLIRKDAIVLEYFDGNEALNDEHDKDFSLREDVARKLARLNALNVPISRNTHIEQIRQMFEVWCSVELIDSVYSGPLKQALVDNNLPYLLGTSLKQETDFVYNALRKFSENDPSIVFSHSDFNHLNLLVVQNKATKKREVKFIDFDFSSYFFRGADLGRYFVDVAQPEQFHSNELVSDSEILQFIEWYRSENAKIFGQSYLNDPKNSTEIFLKETKLFSLYAFMVDIIFCVYIASEAEKEGDQDKMLEFLVHGDKRFNGYLKTKFRFLQDGSIP